MCFTCVPWVNFLPPLTARPAPVPPTPPDHPPPLSPETDRHRRAEESGPARSFDDGNFVLQVLEELSVLLVGSKDAGELILLPLRSVRPSAVDRGSEGGSEASRGEERREGSRQKRGGRGMTRSRGSKPSGRSGRY